MLQEPFPDAWSRIIRTNVAHAAALNPDQWSRLSRFVRIFVAEKNWEGCNGFEVTDEVRVTIAAQVALLSLGDHADYFDHVLSILVYPSAFVAKDRERDSDGVITENNTAMLGQAVWRGPVILSWPEVLSGGQRRRHENLVLHEFAHQLDMMNGWNVDGIPPLHSSDDLRRWNAVMKPEFEQLRWNCSHHRRTVIDCYGAQNEAEFFAVLVEAFFERSAALQLHHSAAYDLLRDYFTLDPAAWTQSQAQD